MQESKSSRTVNYKALMENAFLQIETLQSKLKTIENQEKEPIAIIGMSCRLPGGVDSPEAYWELLNHGVDAITEVPLARWNIDKYYDPNPDTPGKIANRNGGFLSQIEGFDPEFFGIAPREDHSLDPQQRLLLEVSWEALERAHIVPDKLFNSLTGVFIGIGGSDYLNQLATSEIPHAYWGTGNVPSAATGRLSYTLGLTGPNMAVETACSSSLVSVHLACQSLRQGECNLALAGGVNLILSPKFSIVFSQAKMISPDGRCKTFDASANGYVRGEGCGIIVLKRLSDAVANGDNILAVLRGTAVNQDGPSGGLTVPNGPSQVAVIRKALSNGGVDPASVSYIEAHGTGTSLGDPIEVGALGTVFGKTHSAEQPLIIGTAKSNIGHLEVAAGIAGLMKVVLQLQHQQIAPSLHFKQPNPHINWSQLPLQVSTQLIPWQTNGKTRIAGVSSFGFSGTNAHVVLEEAPTEGNRQQATGNSEDNIERSTHLLTLSGKTEKALSDLASCYQNHLKNYPQLKLADICYSANTGRAHFNHRLALVVSNQQELVERLQQYQQGDEGVGIYWGEYTDDTTAPKIAFLFTGQGSQYVNMGRELYQQSATFREAINQCKEILSHLDRFQETSLREILYPAEGSTNSSRLDQTAYTQPVLFAIEYALFKLWQSWGIKPDVVMGHSVGEYVAATVAGVWSLEEGLKLIAARGDLMQQLPSGGEMVSVMASESKVRGTLQEMALEEKVAIAAINGLDSTVISGEAEAVGAIATHLESIGIKTKQLQVSHAFHSPLMEPMLADFEAVASQITYHQPKIPIISNVTGVQADQSIATAQYWVRHVRQPVRFAQGIKELHQQGYDTFLEIGPKPILVGMGYQCLPEGIGLWLPSLRPGVDEWLQMLSSLGQLYVQGTQVDWLVFDRDYTRKKVSLPTYPFQRERYWVEMSEDWDAKAISVAKLHPLINQKFQSPLSQEIFFESDFSAENYPFLPDHRIYEKIIVPGASHISFLLGAASLTLPTTACQLENILFPQALAIPEQGMRKVQVALTPSDGSYTFQFISFDDSLDSQTNGGANNGQAANSWAVHATGKLSAAKVERYSLAGTLSRSQLSLEEIQARCPQNIEGTEIYQHLGERQVQLGPNFRWLQQLWIGEDEVLTQLKVPQTIQDADKYQLHPALIDSCFYSVVALVLNQSDDKSETLVPFSVEKFTFYNPPQSGLLWCHTRRSQDTQSEGQIKADIELFDQHRQLVARVTGFETRKANPKVLLMTLRADLSHWFYEINWQAQPLSATKSSEEHQTGNWLVFAPNSEWVEMIGKELSQKGDKQDNYIWVSPGSEYKKLEAQHYQINPTVAEQFPQLLQDNSEIKGIVHLWGVNETIESVDELQTTQELGCAALLHLVQGLRQAGLTLPIWLVTQGTQSVLEETEVMQPQQGSLWGLGRVIRLEHPEFRCCQVDLDPQSPVTEAIPSLVDELLFGDREDQIAIRREVRYVARLVRQQQKLASQQPSELMQPEASYLITGGLGALGLEVAQWIVKEGAKEIVLTGRSAPNESAQQIIDELETAGASVSVLLGDISIEEDAAKIFQQIETSLPPLKGIIHAAGVLDDGLLQNLSWQQFTKVMAPKVQGTWHLHQFTEDLPLDFFVCFSSMTSVLGNLGQGNYAAANGFMDALAHYRRGMGLPGLSINWGAWATSGMAARLDSVNQKRLESSGISAIKSEQGMQVLELLLSDSPSQVGVFPVNWSAFLRELPGGQTMPFLEAFLATERSLTQKSAFREQLEATPVSERQELLTNHVRSAIAKTLGLQDIQKIGMRQPLFDLGLDSLMAVQLTNSLESSLQAKLGSTLLFDYPTVEKLLSYISSEVLSAELVGTLDEEETAEIKLSDFRIEIEQLSETEAQNLLLQELEKLNF